MDHDVVICRNCGHVFRATAAEYGWRRDHGYVLCKRCANDYEDVGMPSWLVICGIAFAAFLWWVGR